MRDDELLTALERTLVPDPPAAPSGDELRRFLAEVAAAPVASGRRRRSRLPRFLAGGLAVALVGGGTAYAAGDGNRIPAPVRRAAVAIRLPVDSPEVAAAKQELSDLEDAIGRGDADRIAAALQHVDEALARLAPTERATVEPRARTLLALASSAVAAAAPPPAAAATAPAQASSPAGGDRSDGSESVSESGSDAGSGSDDETADRAGDESGDGTDDEPDDDSDDESHSGTPDADAPGDDGADADTEDDRHETDTADSDDD